MRKLRKLGKLKMCAGAVSLRSADHDQDRGQVQRCSTGTLAKTASMCRPHPRQVVLPHLSHVAAMQELVIFSPAEGADWIERKAMIDEGDGRDRTHVAVNR